MLAEITFVQCSNNDDLIHHLINISFFLFLPLPVVSTTTTTTTTKKKKIFE